MILGMEALIGKFQLNSCLWPGLQGGVGSSGSVPKVLPWWSCSITPIPPNVTYTQTSHPVGCFLHYRPVMKPKACLATSLALSKLVDVPQTRVPLNNSTPILTFCGRHVYMDKSPTHL